MRGSMSAALVGAACGPAPLGASNRSLKYVRRTVGCPSTVRPVSARVLNSGLLRSCDLDEPVNPDVFLSCDLDEPVNPDVFLSSDFDEPVNPDLLLSSVLVEAFS